MPQTRGSRCFGGWHNGRRRDPRHRIVPGLSSTAAWQMLGVIPTIGKNDDAEVFSLADAKALAAFAVQNQLGLVSFRSIDRRPGLPQGSGLQLVQHRRHGKLPVRHDLRDGDRPVGGALLRAGGGRRVAPLSPLRPPTHAADLLHVLLVVAHDLAALATGDTCLFAREFVGFALRVRRAATQSSDLPLLLRIQRCKTTLCHAGIEADHATFHTAARPPAAAARRKSGWTSARSRLGRRAPSQERRRRWLSPRAGDIAADLCEIGRL